MIQAEEARVRLDLAAAHRLAVRDGLAEGTWNHLSHVMPGHPDRMLVTPGYLHWKQVTAGNLAVVDSQGALVAGDIPPTRAGWVVHGPVHRLLPHATCLMHVHAPYIVAMSMREEPFDTRSGQLAAQFHGAVAYMPPLSGTLEDDDEGEAIAGALGEARVLMMPNHGAMVAAESVARAYLYLYQLERACMFQILATARDDRIRRISEETAAAIGKQARGGGADRHFDAMRALIDAEEPDYAAGLDSSGLAAAS